MTIRTICFIQFCHLLHDVKEKQNKQVIYFNSTFNMRKTRPCTIHLCSEYNNYFTICTHQNAVLGLVSPVQNAVENEKKKRKRKRKSLKPASFTQTSSFGWSQSRPEVKKKKKTCHESRQHLWSFLYASLQIDPLDKSMLWNYTSVSVTTSTDLDKILKMALNISAKWGALISHK